MDEHAPSLLILSNVLRTRGHTCERATSATSAIASISAFRPHVVLYEWNLRDGEGIGLARSMREAAVGTNPLVIALSTLNEPDGFRLNEQVDEYLVKPFQVDVLDALLMKATAA